MIRFVQIALLLAVTPALAQTDADIGRQLRENWRACASREHSAILAVGAGTAEDAFRGCETEERLYLATMEVAFRDPSSITRLRLHHAQERAKLKTEMQNAIFKEITRRMSRQP